LLAPPTKGGIGFVGLRWVIYGVIGAGILVLIVAVVVAVFMAS
jgi:hypothetical protein